MKLHPGAIQKLTEVRQKVDLDLIDDFETVSEINNLAIRASGEMPEDWHLRAYDKPLRIGKHTLYPLTCAGAVWLDYIFENWNYGETPLYDVARFWAMAYGRTPEAYESMYNEKTVRWKLRWLGICLPILYDDLVGILDSYQSGISPGKLEQEIDLINAKKSKKLPEPNLPQSNINWMIGRVIESEGENYEYWFWDASLTNLRRAYRRAVVKDMDSYKESNNGAPHARDPRVEAQFKLVQACRLIVDKKKGKNETS